MARTAEDLELVDTAALARARQEAVAPRDLFLNLADLGQELIRHLQEGRRLDAFVAAAGMSQIVDDYLHRDIGHLQKVARHLPSTRLITQAAGKAISLIGSRHGRPQLEELVLSLADAVVLAEPGERRDPARLTALAERVVAELEEAPPSLRRSIVRLPACFTTFDQQPADCEVLVREFADRWPDRSRPLMLLGVRTSGSYLAPLCAAYLKTLGFKSVDVLTWRSGQRWLAAERRRLTVVLRAGGLALVVDDPPASGNTLAGAAGQLRRLGMPLASIVLLFQVFDSSSRSPWVKRLQPYQQVALPWERWTIQKYLAPESVKEALMELFAGQVTTIEHVERMPLVAHVDPRVRRSARRHVQARYRVALIERPAGRRLTRDIYVKGTGLGLFGDQSLAIARRLEEFVPHVYGIKNGLMFREWMPHSHRLSGAIVDGSFVAEQIAAYIASRHARLAVSEDLSQHLAGREALWEQGAHLLTRPFGRLSAPARLLLRRPFQQLFRTTRPSIVDGSTTPSQWFIAGKDGSSLRKVDFDESIFWKATPNTYDAVSDLAGAAVHHPQGDLSPEMDRRFSKVLRETYTGLTGDPISNERWLLHEAVNVRKCQERYLYDYELDSGDATALPGVIQALGPLSRDLSRLFERYFGDLFLDDTLPRPCGPFCAVDIDGVLETPWLGFSATTPAGALALRGLAHHGYRTLLATGRSLEEVRERCAAYRLPGGVAEYGAVIYNNLSGSSRRLLNLEQMRAMDAVRVSVQANPGILLDPSHSCSVRAYRIANGGRTGLRAVEIEAILGRLGWPDAVQVVTGRAQTDFVPRGIDKGTGLQALTRELGETVTTNADVKTIALAVGDTAADASIFPLAERPFAPANADAALRRLAVNGRNVTVLSRRYQAGLLQAATVLLGHEPGTCPTCRAPSFSDEAHMLLDLLHAQDIGRLGKVKLLARLRSRQIQ